MKLKYSNKKARCLSKHIHDSVFEANYCNRLLAMKQKGEIYRYSVQVPFELRFNGQHICDHVVDFRVWPNEFGGEEVHEAKGIRTDVWKIKYKLFRVLFPEIPYIIIQKKGWETKCQKKTRMKKFLKKFQVKEKLKES